MRREAEIGLGWLLEAVIDPKGSFQKSQGELTTEYDLQGTQLAEGQFMNYV